LAAVVVKTHAKIILLLQQLTEWFIFPVLQETEKGGGIFLGTS
jgi:hypothetical protein